MLFRAENMERGPRADLLPPDPANRRPRDALCLTGRAAQSGPCNNRSRGPVGLRDRLHLLLPSG